MLIFFLADDPSKSPARGSATDEEARLHSKQYIVRFFKFKKLDMAEMKRKLQLDKVVKEKKLEETWKIY